MLTVTKRFEFCYSHFLPAHQGKCKELHGHNGILEVEVTGRVDPSTGMIIDFGNLKIALERVLEKLDHKHLNKIIENPTAENILLWLVGELGYYHNLTLVRLRLYETRDNWAEWKR